MDPATRDAVREACKRSAAAVLPMVFEHTGTPQAVLDVGAGEGWWSTTAHDLDVGNVLALDVDAALPEPAWWIEAWDAESRVPLPHCMDGRWPLALCLEMAEHVTPAAGDYLVSELCHIADVVLWSAAIPGQTGDGHINEQWPAYWQERFLHHGYMLIDPFRDRLWEQADVEPWYRQNLLLAIPVPHRGDVDLRPPRALIDPVTWAYHRGVAYP